MKYEEMSDLEKFQHWTKSLEKNQKKIDETKSWLENNQIPSSVYLVISHGIDFYEERVEVCLKYVKEYEEKSKAGN